ncbi:MAG: GNAT family N-acetyltransferase [Chitinophagaceae bacterium]
MQNTQITHSYYDNQLQVRAMADKSNFVGIIEANIVKISHRSAVTEFAFDLSGLFISRLMVEKKYRGKGHGRALFKHFLSLADSAQKTVCVVPVLEEGKFNFYGLTAWFQRLGFVAHTHLHGVYVRQPQTVETLTLLDDESEY